MSDWTTPQWTAFGGLALAGAAAVVLLVIGLQSIRAWTAPAPLRRVSPSVRPRPSLELAAARAPLPTVAAMPLDPRSIDPAYLATVAKPIEHDPMTTDYASHGIGSLRNLLVAEADPILETSTERFAWVHADDRGAADVIERFEAGANAVIDAAIARLLKGLSGADLLDAWRIDTPTGGYPIVLPLTRDVRATAEALLIAT